MYTQNAQTDDCEYVREKYVWNAESKDEFINRLEQESVIEKLNLLNVNISNSSNENDLQSCLADFVNLIDDVAAPLFNQFTSLFNKSQVYNICKQQENNIVHTKHVQHLQYYGTETFIKILTLEQYLGDGHQYNRSLLLFFFICIRPLWPRVLEYIRYI